MMVCTAKRAICLEILDKVDILANYEEKVTSPSVTFSLPSVIKIRNFVRYDNLSVDLNRKNIIIRDENTCQYCGITNTSLTIDHIVPKGRGGMDTWENLVAACKKCNLNKGSRTDIKPTRIPIKPNFYNLMAQKNFTLSIKYKVWLDYLDWPEKYIKLVA